MVLPLFLYLIFTNTVNATSAGTSQKDVMWQLIESTYAQTLKVAETKTSLYDASVLLGRPCPVNLPSANPSLDLQAEADYWESNYGFELRGGLTSSDLDDSDNDVHGRTYLELSWDVLNGGYKEFDYRAKELRRKAGFERIQRDLNKVADEYRCRGYQIDSAFFGTESALSTSKLSLMEAVYGIEEKAYFEGISYLDELLISEQSIVELRLKLHSLAKLSSHDKGSFSTINLPVIDLDIKRILQKVEQDPRYAKALALSKKGISDPNPYRDGSRLRLFLRKEFDVLSSDRDDLIAGVRFSVPLTFQQRPDYQNKAAFISQEAALDEWERITRVRVSYKSFMEQLERVVTQEYRYLRAKERIRRALSRKAAGEDIVISAVIARLTTFIDATIELFDAKKSLYQRANNVFLVSRIDYSPEYLEQVTNNVDNYRARPYERSVYLWSSLFNQLSLKQLKMMLKTKSLSNVLLSYGKNTDKAKVKEFITLAKDNNISVELIIGDNSWVEHNNHNHAASIVAVQEALLPAIHLDVEPQALEDYQSNKTRYQQDYIDMLTAIRAQSPDVKLSVSVPFHWDDETYLQINELVDDLYVMNYGDVSDDARSRRIKNILLNVSSDKLVIALRPADFESEFEMEQSIKTLQSATGIERFAFHKLASFMQARGDAK